MTDGGVRRRGGAAPAAPEDPVGVGPILLGVDVGGTFTDVVLVAGGSLLRTKVLSTPADFSEGVLNACADALRHAPAGETLPQVTHATTVVTNALIERKGAVVGLLATQGSEDILEIGNEQRYHIYDLHLKKPAPLVPRHLRRGVAERLLADGSVHQGLDMGSARSALEEILAERIDALAICFLHSPTNPAHEEELARFVAQACPDLHVSLSSQVAPELREWERMTTTSANAYVQPLCVSYLDRLANSLEEHSLGSSLHVMVSNGGIASVDMVRNFPIRLLESGPAAGVMAASFYSRKLDVSNFIAFDMGGTTAKICVVKDGRPRRARSFEAGRVQRFSKGSGLPIRIPVIELVEIGAGGGSIAYLDDMGLLKVGPSSAGADPGPACYGNGGTFPTVTDADLLLGYLNPDFFLGGKMGLSTEKAREALRPLVEESGLSKVDIAAGICRVVNENMALATRVHCAELGEDARKYSLVAFGGAGPVHGYEVARSLGLRQVVVPPAAGTLSAVGLLVAPRAVELARSYSADLERIEWDAVSSLLEEMEGEGAGFLIPAGVGEEELTFQYSVDVRYRGQGFEIEVPIDESIIRKKDTCGLEQAFHQEYLRLFDRVVPSSDIEVLTWRVAIEAPPQLLDVPTSLSTEVEPPQSRRAFFPEAGDFLETRIVRRSSLSPNDDFVGPYIVEDAESTIVVGPSGRARVLADSSLLIEI